MKATLTTFLFLNAICIAASGCFNDMIVGDESQKEDGGTDIDSDEDGEGTCQTPWEGCPFNQSWPSACTNSWEHGEPHCNDGQECIGEALMQAAVGMCELPCDLENDTCPPTEWGLNSQCFDNEYWFVSTMCFVVGCEDEYDCPYGMACTGYATCPQLHACEESGQDPDCKTIPECDDAPVEGLICYPNNY